MTNGSASYRDVLTNEFNTRMRRNPQYSLRAFARDIEMTPQMLSAVLKGQKHLSLDSAAKIATQFGLDRHDCQNFLDLVVFESCKSDLARKMILQRMEDRSHLKDSYRSLSAEVFKAISDWYHLAILELCSCEEFKPDPRWVAGRLGISAQEAHSAIDRLKNLELIEEHSGTLKRTELNISALSESPSSALREHARQILKKGIVALDQQSQGERDISSITMAIDPTLLPEARTMIMKFRRRLSRFLERGKRTEVYVFMPALFRLTQNKERRSE